MNASLENPNLSLTDPDTWDLIFDGPTSKAGVSVTSKRVLGYPPFYRGIALISGDVGRMPLDIFRRMPDNGKESAREHPAHKIIKRVASPIMSAQAFRETLTLHALLNGNGYGAILRDGAGAPRETLILEPTKTSPAIINGQLWYMTEIGGEVVPIPAADVIHIRGPSRDGIVGMDVVSLMAESLGVGLAAREFGARFFADGAVTSGVLMIPGTFTQEKINNTMAAWEKMHGGLTKAHRVALLQDGVKFQPMTIEPEKAQFLATRQFEVREVANILGVPPHKLGDDSRTSFNSLEQENQSYLDDGLERWLTAWECEFSRKLLTEEEQDREGFLVEFNRSARLRTQLKERVESYGKLKEIGAFTTNDIMRRENMPTIGPAGDIRYRPANWVEVGAEQANEQMMLEDVIIDRVNRLVTIECELVNKAARRPECFLDTVRQVYIRHFERMADALMQNNRRWRSNAVFEFIHSYCADSHDACVEAAGEVDADGLAGRITMLTASWNDRTFAVAAKIWPVLIENLPK